jgi:hypothetical protein
MEPQPVRSGLLGTRILPSQVLRPGLSLSSTISTPSTWRGPILAGLQEDGLAPGLTAQPEATIKSRLDLLQPLHIVNSGNFSYAGHDILKML